jgi:hypothetical protein
MAGRVCGGWADDDQTQAALGGHQTLGMAVIRGLGLGRHRDGRDMWRAPIKRGSGAPSWSSDPDWTSPDGDASIYK